MITMTRRSLESRIALLEEQFEEDTGLDLSQTIKKTRRSKASVKDIIERSARDIAIVRDKIKTIKDSKRLVSKLQRAIDLLIEASRDKRIF